MQCPFNGCQTPAPHGHAASHRRLREGRDWSERVAVMDAGDFAAGSHWQGPAPAILAAAIARLDELAVGE